MATGARATNGQRPFIAMSQPFAAGALVSTVDDLALWNTAIERGRLLSDASRARWFAPYTLPSGRATGYAMGWSVTQPRGPCGGGARRRHSRVRVSRDPDAIGATLRRGVVEQPRPGQTPSRGGSPRSRSGARSMTRPWRSCPRRRSRRMPAATTCLTASRGITEGRLSIERHGVTQVSASGPADFFEPDGVLRLTFQPASGATCR